MAQQEDKIPLSKKGKREISPFIGHELLYDYLSGSLDKERRAAVEDHVKFSRDAQLDLNKIQNGQSYAEKLADTVVSEPIIAQISAPSSYLTVLMQKSNFDKWPQGLKWGLEALVVVLVIVTLLTVTPWQKVMQLGVGTGSKEVVLAEVSKSGSSQVVVETPEFVDEGVKEATPAPTATTVAAKTPEKPQPVATPTATTAKAEEIKAAETTASPATGGGFLYRGEIAVTNVDVVGPKITDKILGLGGRKAGSVELGWRKAGTNSMYYHFTIPEAKYQDLLTFLGTYGKAKLTKEKHPRVMPDGIIRLIITVDEAKK
ncbi:zf-HC2 domain-containing protein [Bdellovibrio sp. 22V]|uniref:zf-HC2 domain-containing protein n=1 Tax=Bdellovibrio TaxID=958 RepID=UPI002542E483|nr:zf-HC2 domain-containing protein [Bdellovibrio sp. 22V]WII70790.1 zf-HC2 domain-containing protein [Bdellovibrio sp. 22V]